MKVHYLEVVTPNVSEVCSKYEEVHDCHFDFPDDALGGARCCELSDGSIIGVRAPMRDTEEPVVRPYWLTEDIDQAVKQVELSGGEIAHPAMEIPGKGKFAIYIYGGIQQGLWQL